MPLDPKLQQFLERALRGTDDQGAAGPRLAGDARRLWNRIQKFIAMKLVADGLELEPLELATYAIQLPMRRLKTLSTGRPARATLRERAEEAAELLIGLDAPGLDDGQLDRTTRLLHEMPQRPPMLDEAKLLADALNLDDFGVTGIATLAIQLARQGEGVLQLVEGAEKREQYGYWDARLKDGFHFEPVRQIARRRLDNARHVAMLLQAELREDGV